MSGEARTLPILSLEPTADQTGKEGYAVEASSGKAAILDNAADVPLGVITDGEATTGRSSIALCDAGPIVKVKMDGTPGTVVLGTYLQITATGTFKADAGSGARVLAARALEAGAANELIDAVLVKPETKS